MDKSERDAQYRENKDEINKRRREKYKNDPEYKATRQVWSKKYLEKVKNDPELLEKKRETKRKHYRKRTDEQKEKRRAYNNSYLASEDQLTKKKIRRKLRYQERMEWIIETFGGECMQCGLKDHPLVYDFHHVDPSTKSFTIAAEVSDMNIDKLIAELKKCVLICSRCHRKITYGLEELKCVVREDIVWDVSKLKINKCSDKWQQQVSDSS